MNNLFTIIFKDNSNYFGGTLEIPKWKEIPDKNIRSIFYSLPTNDVLCLAGFKNIYHYVEVTMDLNGKKGGKTKIEYTYLIIERDNQFIQYKINQIDFGIEINILNKDSNYIKGLNPIGWKKGDR
jgi:hypothetical protein